MGDRRGARDFAAVPYAIYRGDPNWTPPLPGEIRQTFDPRSNPSLEGVKAARWVWLDGGAPRGRVAAFTDRRRPDVGYFGFFECPNDSAAAALLLDAAERWLADQGCRTCYGPIAVSPRDCIGLLVEGFDRPATLFTPYNPPWYRGLLEGAGYASHVFLRAYGWTPGRLDGAHWAGRVQLAARHSRVRIRGIRLDHLRYETRLIASLVNETLADAWHFDPIDYREADQMARLLRPIIDPALALVAEDDEGPCGVALAVPDVNWLWRKAGGRLFPTGWFHLLRWRRHIPVARLMALGLAERVRGSSVALRLIGTLHAAGLARNYRDGELSQVFDDNSAMRRILERLDLPVVHRYAVFRRSVEA